MQRNQAARVLRSCMLAQLRCSIQMSRLQTAGKPGVALCRTSPVFTTTCRTLVCPYNPAAATSHDHTCISLEQLQHPACVATDMLAVPCDRSMRMEHTYLLTPRKCQRILQTHFHSLYQTVSLCSVMNKEQTTMTDISNGLSSKWNLDPPIPCVKA